jgi:hypothetical protein
VKVLPVEPHCKEEVETPCLPGTGNNEVEILVRKKWVEMMVSEEKWGSCERESGEDG